ncbi:hypothetical protein ALC53_05498, partial [Atta colombica]
RKHRRAVRGYRPSLPSLLPRFARFLPGCGVPSRSPYAALRNADSDAHMGMIGARRGVLGGAGREHAEDEEGEEDGVVEAVRYRERKWEREARLRTRARVVCARHGHWPNLLFFLHSTGSSNVPPTLLPRQPTSDARGTHTTPLYTTPPLPATHPSTPATRRLKGADPYSAERIYMPTLRTCG